MTQENVSELLWVDTDRLGGRVCFYGTRLSFHFMVEKRLAGDTLEELQDCYPGLTPAQWQLVEREYAHANWKPEDNGVHVTSRRVIAAADLPDEWIAALLSAKANVESQAANAELMFRQVLRDAYGTCPPDVMLDFDDEAKSDQQFSEDFVALKGTARPGFNLDDDDDDEELEDEVVFYGMEPATELREVDEWEEVHPRFKSMSEAAHQALCIKRSEVKPTQCGFHIPRKAGGR